MGNPAAEPEVEKASADGSRIDEIRYRSAWPGVDAVIRTMPGGWSSNLIVQPGVNPGVIEMEYVGATELTVDRAGRLHVQIADGEWIDGTPESWQDGPSGREPVDSQLRTARRQPVRLRRRAVRSEPPVGRRSAQPSVAANPGQRTAVATALRARRAYSTRSGPTQLTGAVGPAATAHGQPVRRDLVRPESGRVWRAGADVGVGAEGGGAGGIVGGLG